MLAAAAARVSLDLFLLWVALTLFVAGAVVAAVFKAWVQVLALAGLACFVLASLVT